MNTNIKAISSITVSYIARTSRGYYVRGNRPLTTAEIEEVFRDHVGDVISITPSFLSEYENAYLCDVHHFKGVEQCDILI